MTVSLSTYTLINARTFQLAGHLVSRVDTDARVVALTFDDGPTDHTPEVLEVLASRNVPATFYLNGSEAQRHRDLVTAIANAGHEIGNHSYSHRRMVFVSENTVSDEIERTDEAVRHAGYGGPLTFRPPYGKKLWTLPRYLAARDRVTVMWDVAPDSAGNPDRDAIVEHTVRSVRPGSIVLLHVLVDSRSESRAALPRIIEQLSSSGYRFVTVSQLLAMRGNR
ncbi:MAG: polysaccharide deacetylase family protein [Mycolicibacterium neoaurum]|uniref:polysaccharide deacetylase family protein n=1 Tax=Mycolicibacterium neoaurum TaxID=1795 RepID=UPI002FF8A7F6